MTQNQIAYWKNQYDLSIGQKNAAANLKNAETRARELEETQRANLAKELLTEAADRAKYGRTAYNLYKDDAAEYWQVSKEMFDWLLDTFTGVFKTVKGGKR